MWKQYLIVFSALALVLLGFQNCSKIQFGVTELGRLVDRDDAVCDPFDNSEGGSGLGVTDQNGLIGQLRYLTLGVHGDSRAELNSRDIDYYLNEGLPADGTLFFSSIVTPTMSFTRGFQNGRGETLQNPVTMEDLVEYFSLHFESQMTLSLGDEPGLYQLALLSDDGSALYLLDEERPGRFIDNDGTHSARLACSSQTVEMKLGEAIPFQVHYFQGPRTDIAFQMLWRKVDDGNLNDPLCGQSGRYLFFEGYDNGGDSVPTQSYLDLQDRGWQLLRPENFLLPEEIESNPCVTETQ